MAQYFTDDLLIPYAYQPIFSLRDRSIYGYEALMRPKGSNPEKFIFSCLTESGAVDTHKIELITLYSALMNFTKPNGLLFVNSFPNECLSDAEFAEFKGTFGKELLSRLVVELLEYPKFDSDAWKRKLAQVREVGSLIAIDDYGTGLNDKEMIRRCGPDIVKLDACMIRFAMASDDAPAYLNKKILEFDTPSISVVVEGLETKGDVVAAIRSRASFGQGYYLAEPMLPEEEEAKLKEAVGA